MKLDLHIHSHVSDGRLSPTAVVQAAVAGGLNVIALTDHDTAEGVPEALEAAAAYEVAVVPGIEISTRHGEYDFHILGYWIDAEHPALLEHQRSARLRRDHRMRGMISKLHGLGLPIRYEDVLDAAGSSARVLGRPHLARALHAAGLTRYYGEAFDRYIGDHGPAFVLEEFPTVEDAIRRIRAAGGLAVWAHPPRDDFDREIDHFAECGLAGVECLRPGLTTAESFHLETQARARGLLVTGGSDWHGPHHAALGEFHVRGHQVREFLEAEQSRSLRR